MAAADDPAPCPNGHTDTVRLLPTVAVTRIKAGGTAGPSRKPAPPSAGGCCGGGCCS